VNREGEIEITDQRTGGVAVGHGVDVQIEEVQRW
jgi:hypothetical protein